MRFRYPRSGNNRFSFSARFWQALQGLMPTAVVTRLMASPRPRTDVGGPSPGPGGTEAGRRRAGPKVALGRAGPEPGGPVDPAEPEAPSPGPALWRLVFKMNTFV
jgi:hypothetical protein